MKYYLLIVLGFMAVAQSFAQFNSFFVADGDTIFREIRVKRVMGEYRVYSGSISDGVESELYAGKTTIAKAPEGKVYYAVQNPETKQIVWMRCLFEGKDFLFEGNGALYIQADGKVYKLTETVESSERGKNRYKSIGIITFLYHDKIDYPFQRMSISAEDITALLEEYHRKNRWEYSNYSASLKLKREFCLNGGTGVGTIRMFAPGYDFVELQPNSFDLGAGWMLRSRLPRYLGFYLGVNLSCQVVDQTIGVDKGFNMEYFSMKTTGFGGDIPLLLQARIVDTDKFQLFLESGIQISGYKWGSSNVIVETVSEDNEVFISHFEFEPKTRVELGHRSQLLVGVPLLASKLGLGLSYTYALGTREEIEASLSCVNSVQFFIRYTLK